MEEAEEEEPLEDIMELRLARSDFNRGFRSGK